MDEAENDFSSTPRHPTGFVLIGLELKNGINIAAGLGVAARWPDVASLGRSRLSNAVNKSTSRLFFITGLYLGESFITMIITFREVFTASGRQNN